MPSRPLKLRWIAVFALAAASMAAANAGRAQGPRLAPAVAASPPAEGGLQSFPCQVQASERVELASPVAGTLEKVEVDRGDVVRVGQVVAGLRADIERANVALAEARAAADSQLRSKRVNFAFQERRLQRNLELGRNVVSQNDIDQIRTERDMAELDVAAAGDALNIARMELLRARAELAIRTIHSPLDGIVIERRLNPGDLVADKPIVIIAKVDPLYAEAALPVALLGSIKLGAPATISFEAPGVKPRSVTVGLVDATVEPMSNTFGVRFVIPNAGRDVPAGIKCRATFDSN